MSRTLLPPAVLAAAWVALGSAAPARAVTVPSGFVVENAVSGSAFSGPVGMAFLPDGRFIVCQQTGTAYMVRNGARLTAPVWNGTNEVLSNGDRGLLGVAVDPRFFQNHYVYFLYTVDPDSNGVDTDASGFGRLTRYTMRATGDTNTVDPATRTILMGVDWRHGKLDGATSHSIGSLRWGRDGSLLVSAGEGADFNQMDAGGLYPAAFGSTRTDPNEDIGAFRAQDITNLGGKILRLDPATGLGYPSNPFYNGDPTAARSKVWAYGFRNPFRFGLRPGTGSTDPAAGNPGVAFVGDVGWATWEELDVVTLAGQNFGWPCNEGFGPVPVYQSAAPAHNGCGTTGTATNPSGWRQPASVWHHTLPTRSVPPGVTGIAAVGGTFYADTVYPGQYRGRYFFADYGGDWIRAATFSSTNNLISIETLGTSMDVPVDLQRSPVDGNLYYVSITTGQIRRIRYTGTPGGNAAPVAPAVASPTSGPVPLSVSFSGADTFDPEGDALTFAWTFGDGGTSSLQNPSHLYTTTGTYTAILTVSDGHGGQSQSSTVITVGATGSFPTTAVLDNFNRPDGPLGSPWLGTTGLSISSNQMIHTLGYANPVWGGASFGPDQEAYVTLAAVTPGAPEHDLMLKIQGTSDAAAHLEIRYDDNLQWIAIGSYEPGAGWREHGIISPATFVAGDQFGARARADGVVQVFKNGALLGSYSALTWPYATAGGSIGMTLSQTFQSRFDDFGGGNHVTVSASPVAVVTSPNGGESWAGGSTHAIQWTATDDVAVTLVDLFYREHAGSPWTPLAVDIPNTGTFDWAVHDTPTSDARVRVVAYDADGHSGEDTSNADFAITARGGGIVHTTLRDFTMPGTQPHGAGGFSSQSACNTCHSGYSAAVEPGRTARGTMMSNAARDPLFYACLAVAEQDAPNAGDLCIRCHAPMSWLSGLSQPTDGSRIDALGRESVGCDFCHRLVDPVYKSGVSPAEDLAVLSGMLPSHIPTGYANGQYVLDSSTRRRGPFADPQAPHEFLASPFHTSSDLCGTCHDVSNPVYARVSGARYAAGPLDTPADSISSSALMPLERTYSEWKNSAFPAGVVLPDFAGNAPGGVVSSCQDCHMRAVTGQGCNAPGAPVRTNLPLHDLTGGNAWMGGVMASLYPAEADPVALADASVRAVATLQKAATLGLVLAPEADSLRASVTVTNRSGHKLPTGYPEGRRMWLDVRASDAGGTVLYESCPYDTATGVLAPGPGSRVYEVNLGISRATGAALGFPHGASFHFALNDSVYKDNRIPPLGFTNAAYDAFGGMPVDPAGPAPRYPDNQNWDVSDYPLPPGTVEVTATLYYQTTSKEYVEFLRDANTTNTAGQTLYGAWTANRRSPPVVMATATLRKSAGVQAAPLPTAFSVRPLSNPSRGTLELSVGLPRAADGAPRGVRRGRPLRGPRAVRPARGRRAPTGVGRARLRARRRGRGRVLGGGASGRRAPGAAHRAPAVAARPGAASAPRVSGRLTLSRAAHPSGARSRARATHPGLVVARGSADSRPRARRWPDPCPSPSGCVSPAPPPSPGPSARPRPPGSRPPVAAKPRYTPSA